MATPKITRKKYTENTSILGGCKWTCDLDYTYKGGKHGVIGYGNTKDEAYDDAVGKMNSYCDD